MHAHTFAVQNKGEPNSLTRTQGRNETETK